VFKRFERWGFFAVAVPAILPPPFPIVPFLLAAGALQYSRRKFVLALALGRGVRFTIVAGLGAIYGRHIVRFFSRYYKPALFMLIALAVIAGIISLVQYYRYKSRVTTA
jgi:membrane protein DedA with SNARE-associated domain